MRDPRRFRSSLSGQPPEIDMRVEMDRTLFGSSIEKPKGYRVLIRRLRLDARGRRITCSCNLNGSGTGSSSPQCSHCLGEGYIWDEVWATCFKTEVGSESAKARRVFLLPEGAPKGQLQRFYFRFDADVQTHDKIVELQKSSEGDLIKPYRRGNVWQIQEIEEWRSDGGRLEFLVCYGSKVNHLHGDYSRFIK